MATGHFIVRRLEIKYGLKAAKQEYQRPLVRQRGGAESDHLQVGNSSFQLPTSKVDRSRELPKHHPGQEGGFSGSANHFGDVGARVTDLDVIFLTHLHVDHAADLPVIVKSSFFGNRTRPLPVLGPAASNLYPSTPEFVRLLFDRRGGLYRYLGDYLTGEHGAYTLRVQDLILPEDRLNRVFSDGGLILAFSGDTSGNNKTLIDLARDADIFVAHNAIPEEEEGVGRALPMPPSVIGVIAREARVKKLVLSHFMMRTLGREKETIFLIRKNYEGPLFLANDLDCFPLGK